MDIDRPALEVRGVTVRYGPVTAIMGIDLVVARGDVLGLLGPNGAGKSTLLRVCCGLVAPAQGSVHILGRDVWRDSRRARAVLGYLHEEAIAYPHLTGREFLELMADLHRLPRGRRRQEAIGRLCEALGLEADLDALIGASSLGVRKKVELVSILLHEPVVLLLDEPTNGLDAATALQALALLRGFADRGSAVVLSTHQADVVRAVCNRVAILDSGRLMAVRTVQRRRTGAPPPDDEPSRQVLPAGASP
jgi:ABC-type multidrug transport system ATPase subunit